MALNKRKVLEAARRHVQKGAKAKALKGYEKLLKADPRDAKLVLEVGDAYRRWGQNDEAIAQYAKVAQLYQDDGFDARAVAVFKQILNLDPKNYDAYVTLSELYTRMGLDSEAVSSLQTAADGYHKEGRKVEALDLLRQMAAIDPTNTTSRLKVAELLRQEGMEGEAFDEYEAVVAELENQGDRDQLITVLDRMLELRPDDVGALTGLARGLMESAEFDRAEPLAIQACDLDPSAPQFELLIELYGRTGDDGKLAEATRGLARLHRERGDEQTARELMQRLPTDDVALDGALALEVSETEEPDVADADLLDDDEPFLALDDEAPDFGLVDDDVDATEAIELSDTSIGEFQELEGADGGVEPDQLIAEANVYLRYGKHEQAISSLRGVLAQAPGHRVALEKIGEAHLAAGESEEALAAWLKAGDVARDQGEREALAAIRERIAAVDPDLAASLDDLDPLDPSESVVVAEVGDDSGPGLEIEDDEAIEIELSIEGEDAAVAPPFSSTEDGGSEDAAIELEIDSEIDLESMIDDLPEADDLLAPDLGEDGLEIEVELDEDSLSYGISLEPDASAIEVETASKPAESNGDGSSSQSYEGLAAFDFDAGELGSSADVSSPGASSTSSALIAGELEEAEFFLEQSMLDDAERLFNRILEIAPNHPAALLRLGEIAAARGQEPDDAVPVVEGGPEPGDTAVEAEGRFHPDHEVEFELDLEEEDVLELGPEGLAGTSPGFDVSAEAIPSLEERAAGEATPDDETSVGADEALASANTLPAFDPTNPVAEELELDVDVPESIESSEVVEAEAGSTSEDAEIAEPEATDLPSELPVGLDEAEASGPAEATEVAVDPGANPEAACSVPEQAVEEPDDSDRSEGQPFDLREALADVLGEDDDPNATSGVLSTVEDGFESIFSDFKRGVSATLEEGDFDTRYDLGIAYREMGLYADAIGEFTVCLEAPERRFDSLYLMGLCARDLRRFDDAVSHFEQALALPEVPEDRMAGVYFDLSVAEEGVGDVERACGSLRRVLELDADFPEAAERLAALESGEFSPTQSSGSSEDFESFEDLFEDSSEDVLEEDPAGETFESFDDVVSDAQAMLEEAERMSPESSSVEEAPPAPPSSDESKRETPRRSGRNKKISFI